MATVETITTASQLFDSSEIGPCELIRGELVMMSPAGYEHGRITQRIAVAIGNHVALNKLGEVVAAETGFLISREPDTVRAPDVGVVLCGRLPTGLTAGFFPGAPDLAVEVLSPNDRASDVNAKVQDWLQAGCREVWVVDPKTKTVAVNRTPREIAILGIGEAVTAEDILPGFSVNVAEIFA